MKNFIGISVLALMTTSLASAADVPLDPAERTVNGMYQISANWSALRASRAKLSLQVVDANGQPVPLATLKVDYDSVDMAMNPPNLPIVELGGGKYEKPLEFGMPGVWKFKIKVTQGASTDTLERRQSIR